MTTERQPETTPATPEPGSLESFIATETANDITEEVATEQVLQEVVEVAEVPETPEPEVVEAEPSVAPGAEAPAQPVGTETQPERTYSTDEWSKRESALQQRDATRAAEMAQQEQQRNAEMAQIRQQLGQKAVEDAIQQHAASEEARLTPLIGTEEARRAAQDPAFLQQTRQQLTTVQQNVFLQQQAGEMAQMQEGAGRQVRGAQLMTQYNVPEDKMPLVMGAATPAHMEALARAFAGTAKAAPAAPKGESKVTSGSAERIETGASEAPPLDNFARLEALNEKHFSEWSDEDHRFMSKVNGGQVTL